MHFRLGFDYDPFKPGLEYKFALEEAERAGANIEFMGNQFNDSTISKLFHETRFNIPEYLLNRWHYQNSLWSQELLVNRNKVRLVGAKAFTEKCLDEHLINWYIQATDKFFPQMKRVMIDNRDEELYRQIDRSKGKRVVALVN